jgi:hypothetical protein
MTAQCPIRTLRIVSLAFMCLITVYVVSYVALSRRGFALSEAAGYEGFYFFPPEDTNTWRRINYGCVFIFYPLIMIDNWIGTGKPIAHEPLWSVTGRSRPQTQSLICHRSSLIPRPASAFLTPES